MSNPIVVVETSKGPIEIELWEDKTPISAKNFLTYADSKFYDNTVFHRVISGFMIQGGGFTPDMKQKETKAAIKNEANPEYKNLRGTIAMARTSDPQSATAQFFINHADNDFLNQRDRSDNGFGYAVFGKVTKGMDVVDEIAKVPTKNVGGHGDVPSEPVIIKSVRKK